MLAALSAAPFVAVTTPAAAATPNLPSATPWARANEHAKGLLDALTQMSESGDGWWACHVAPDSRIGLWFENLHAKQYRDAELLELEREFDRILPGWDAATAECDRLHDVWAADCAKAGCWGDWEAMKLLASFDAREIACGRCNALGYEIDEVAKRIRGIKAKTMKGIVVKLKVLRCWEMSPEWRVQGRPINDWDWDHQCFDEFYEEVAGLARFA